MAHQGLAQRRYIATVKSCRNLLERLNIVQRTPFDSGGRSPLSLRPPGRGYGFTKASNVLWSKSLSWFAGVPGIFSAAMVGVLLLPGCHRGLQVGEQVEVGVEVDQVEPLAEIPFERSGDAPIFESFWELTGRGGHHLGDGTSGRSPQAEVDLLYAYALERDGMTGTISPQADREVSLQEAEWVRRLVAEYEDFITPGAADLMAKKFGFRLQQVGEAPEHSSDEGSVKLPDRVSLHAFSDLVVLDTDRLADKMTEEYHFNRKFFEDPTLTVDEKGKKVLGLLRDYSEALIFKGQNQWQTHPQAQQALLHAYDKFPFAREHGAKDYNGAGFGAAQSLVYGLDVNHFPTSFPDKIDVTTYAVSMYGRAKMDSALAKVDAYWKALGEPVGAVAHHNSSIYSNYVGQPKGNRFKEAPSEEKPFDLGINWGLLLFPGDAEVAARAPKEGFNFPIDFIDAFGGDYVNDPAGGDHLMVYDSTGQQLRVEKVLHDEDPDVPAWSARFFRADGSEVQPDSVLARIHTQTGWTKGDGKADQTLYAAYNGFCDLNAAMRMRGHVNFRIKDFDRPKVPVKAGDEVILFDREEAQRIIDAAMGSIAGNISYAGFRFQGWQAATVGLKDGRTVMGKVLSGGNSYWPVPGVHSEIVEQDVIRVQNHPDAPLPDLEVQGFDGSTVAFTSDDVAWIQGETQNDSRFAYHLALMALAKGYYIGEFSEGRFVSNGTRHLKRILVDVRDDGRSPKWAKEYEPLVGVVGGEPDSTARVVFVEGENTSGNLQFRGWYRVDKETGYVVDEAYTSGLPDFLWPILGPLQPHFRPGFSPYVPPDLVQQLLVNGYEDVREVDAKLWNLPTDWKKMRIEVL